MGFLPDEAGDRIVKDKIKPSAAVLYAYGFCRYRNALSGRCLVPNETLAQKTAINIAQLSTSKSQLIEAGWIAKDPENSKHGVIPLVGAREFEEQRKWRWVRMKEAERWKFQNRGFKVWNYQTGTLENPSFLNIRYVPDDSPSVTTSTTVSSDDNLDIPNLKRPPAEGGGDLCDEAYVALLIETGAYPPHLNPAMVRYVWNDYRLNCLTGDKKRPVRTPSRNEFKVWLLNQRAIVQQALPVEGVATVVSPKFEAGARPRAQVGMPPGNVSFPLNPNSACAICEGREEYRASGGVYCVCRICQMCFGTGMQSEAGKGARRCPHITGEADERQARAG